MGQAQISAPCKAGRGGLYIDLYHATGNISQSEYRYLFYT